MARSKMFGPALPPAMKKARAAAKRSAKKAPATKKDTVALIKQVVARSDETKFRSELIVVSYNLGGDQIPTPYNGQITSGDPIRVFPKLVQDQGEGAIYERMGRKIKPQKLQVSVNAALTNVDRSTAVVVCWWLVTHKEIKNTPGVLALSMADFLKTGSATNNQGFNGYFLDSGLPVNDTKYSVLKSGKFKLGKQTGTIQDSTTAGNQPIAQAVNHAWTINIKTPQTLTYEQDENAPRTVYYPSGFAPFLVFGYYHQDMTPADAANQDISLQVRSSLWFDDA